MLAQSASEDVLAFTADQGFPELRHSHGYVFQHLMHGPISINALAERLGMTPQGASKAIIELEGMGFVRRVRVAADARTRLVELTERGQEAIDASRAARAELNRRYRKLIGKKAHRQLMVAMRELAVKSGSLEKMSGRKMRPPQ